jgi:hypothetical protein
LKENIAVIPIRYCVNDDVKGYTAHAAIARHATNYDSPVNQNDKDGKEAEDEITVIEKSELKVSWEEALQSLCDKLRGEEKLGESLNSLAEELSKGSAVQNGMLSLHAGFRSEKMTGNSEGTARKILKGSPWPEWISRDRSKD